jgi:hypothetical protein
MITQEILKENLSYDSNTGEFLWVKNGLKAGTINKDGYVIIKFNKKRYPAHRLAWLYTYGEMPKEFIDHINRARSDNRIENLRQATRKQNAINSIAYSNNKSGFKGVSYDSSKGKFRAQCVVNGKNKHIGYFDNASLASKAYKEKSSEINGEFVAI